MPGTKVQEIIQDLNTRVRSMANDHIYLRARGATPERDEVASDIYRASWPGLSAELSAFQSLWNWPIGSKVNLMPCSYPTLFEPTVRSQLTALLARYVVTSEMP